MKSLKIPEPTKSIIDKWPLTERERMALDLMILLPISDADCYKMVFLDKGWSATLLKSKSSALKTSSDGREYIEERSKQLSDNYWPEYSEEKTDEKADSGMLSMDFAKEAIKNAERIIKDRNDPNFTDVLKLGVQKVAKDMQMSNQAIPPIRYLPEVCNSCRYRLFVEKECVDECKRCRYKCYANENGVFYSEKEQLK